MRGSGEATLGALLMAAVSTLGDFVWARWIPSHLPGYGLAHGTLLFLVLGAWLGVRRGRVAAGAAGGAAIGLGAAGGFYLLAPWLGVSAMFAMWFLLWIAVAALAAVLSGARPASGEMLARGLGAATASGLGFWAISGIWLSPHPGGPNYLWNLGAWSVAFLPGFAALLLRRG